MKKNKCDRNSLLVKTGRLYQNVSIVFYPIDFIFQKLIKKKKDFPVIVLLAPPRSGSTLTYQVLTSGIKSFHLTNIWNLLYATPTIGGLISQKVCKSHQSNFKSNFGFVSGLCGEAEGLKFWSFWSGQTLKENKKNLKGKKLKKTHGFLKRTNKDNEPFITGYLGHVFCIEMLEKVFPKAVFIHLKRDLLSNAYSLFKSSKEIWPSVKPKEYLNCKNISKHQASVVQLLLIHKKIIEKTKKENTLTVDYHSLCENPQETINKFLNFSKKKNMQVSLKKNNIPNGFKESKVDANLNKDTYKIQEFLEKEINKEEFLQVKNLFKND